MKAMLFCTVVMLGLVGCDSTVEIDVPRSASKVTVNAFFTPDSVWSVVLSKNRYILDNNQFESLPEAEVEVWQNEQLITALPYLSDDTYRGRSVYRATETKPLTGVPYTLRIKHPDFPTLVAQSQVPPVPQIVSASLDVLDVRQDGSFNSNEVAYGLTLRLDDPPEENFYSLSLLIRRNDFGTTGINNDLLLIEEGISFVDIRSDDPVADNAFDNYRDELLFKDVSFNGDQYEIKVYGVFKTDDLLYTRIFDEGFVLQENAYDRRGNIVRQIGDTVGVNTLHVVLRNTTQEYYSYNFTRDLQASVENNPFAQPVQVFDNIDSGLGVFAGYNQEERKIIPR